MPSAAQLLEAKLKAEVRHPSQLSKSVDEVSYGGTGSVLRFESG